MKNALIQIGENENEKPVIRCEANGILKILNSLETSFLSIFWGDILHRFNTFSKKLQSVNIDLSVVVELYQSLINYISDIRTDKDYENYKKMLLKNMVLWTSNKLKNDKKKLRNLVMSIQQNILSLTLK